MYFVSRQWYYYSNIRVVEVAEGGIDSSGCDTLVDSYPGEGQEYNDPREAIEVAISIWKAWVEDGSTPTGIAVGFGCIAELEPTLDLEELRENAKAEYEGLEKCPRCSDLIEESYIIYELDSGTSFCSEYCAEEEYNSIMEDCEEA